MDIIKSENPITQHGINLNNKENRTQVMRVLRFFRVFMHVSAQTIADNSEDHLTRSLIAAVEAGTRNPSTHFIKQYADSLQGIVKLKQNLILISYKCINDSELMDYIDEYERGIGRFVIPYKISKRIMELTNVENA